MTQDFMIGSECADWWEKRNKEYHEELEQYVLENPGYFAVFVATAKATAADFGTTMWVDLARLGEGAAEGSVKGIVQDVFRVLNFVPEAKVLSGSKTLLSRAVQLVSNFLVWRRITGSACVPIAIAQVFQRGGHGIGVTLAGIAKGLGTSLPDIIRSGVLRWSAVEGALSKLGLQFSRFEGAAYRTFDALKRLASGQPGTLLVGIEAADGAKHAILLGRTATGIKIIDRYGIFNSLDDLARHYKRGAWTMISSEPIFSIANAVIDESLLKLVAQLDVLACLVRQSIAVFDINFSKTSKEALDADFEKFLARKGKKKVLQVPAMEVAGGYTVEVTAGHPDKSTLSGIAKAQYGDFNLWPLIFDLNKDKIGPNPNRLKPGTRLLLLPINHYTAAELTDARKRGPTWRNYPL